VGSLATHPYSQGLQYASALNDDVSLELKPGVINPDAKGCSLYERCPRAAANCQSLMPPMQALAVGRVACHYAKT
jgi:ABC-type dipeptide/oligopeptide/nickel transport system ATPase component